MSIKYRHVEQLCLENDDSHCVGYIGLYSNLNHRRDSARRPSLGRTRSFKVIDVVTKQKVVGLCDFLLVNNTIIIQ